MCKLCFLGSLVLLLDHGNIYFHIPHTYAAKFRVHGLPLKAPVTCASILDYGRALQAATGPIEVKKYRLEV